MTCKNCNKDFEGSYCPHCGQKFINHFTWGYLGRLVLSSLEMNRGFLHNVRDLTIRPAKMMHGYLAGRTIHYLNPFSYLVFVLAIVSLLAGVTDSLNIYGTSEQVISGLNDDKQYYLYTATALFLIAGFYLSFKISEKKNALETLILSIYSSAHFVLVIGIVIIFLKLVNNDWITILGLLLFILYTLWFLYKFFGDTVSSLIWKSVVCVLVAGVFGFGGYFAYAKLRRLAVSNDLTYQMIKTKEEKASDQLTRSKEFALILEDKNLIRLHNETMSLVDNVDNMAMELISITGGVFEGEGYTGALKEIDQRMINFLPEIKEKKFLDALAKCGCEYQESSFHNIQSIVGENLHAALDYLYSQQLFILLVERECITSSVFTNPEANSGN